MIETEKLLVTCPECRKRLRVKPELAGKRVRCPNKECAHVIAVPAQQLEEELAAPQTSTKHIWVYSAASVFALAAAAFGIWFFVLRTPGPTAAPAIAKKTPSINLDQGIPTTAVEPLLRAFGYELPDNGAMETRTSAATGKTTRKFFRQCKHAKLTASMIYATNPDAPAEYSLRSGTFTADDPASRQALAAFAASIDPALGKAFQEAQSEFDKSQKAVEKGVGKFRVSVDSKHVELSLNWMPAAKKVEVEPAPEKKTEDAPRAKNISESKAWSVKLVKASRGVIENWAYLGVEFKALTPEKESAGERLVAYKDSFQAMGLPNESYLFMIDLGNIAEYTRKLGGGSPTPSAYSHVVV